MNISNLLEQLNLGSVKEGTPTVVVIKLGSTPTEEPRSAECKAMSKKTGKKYSIPSKHIVIASKKPVSKIDSTFVETDNACTFCSMYGNDNCCLHHKESNCKPWSTYRNAVEKGLTLSYEGLVFKAVPSSKSSKFILKVDGEVGVIKK